MGIRVGVAVAVGSGVCVGRAVSVNADVGVESGIAGVQAVDTSIAKISKLAIRFMFTPG